MKTLATVNSAPTMHAVHGDSFALTPMQSAMLLGSLRRGPAFELQQLVVKLEAEVDIDRLLVAWREVVARHPMLRVRMAWHGSATPSQVVEPQVDVAMASLATDDLDAYLAQDRAQGIDLSTAPAFRLALLNAQSTQPVLVFSHHHAMLDGRSVRLLVDEVFGLVDRRDGSPLPPAGHAFRAHCEALERTDPTSARDYFLSLLDGVEPLLFPSGQGDIASPVATPGRAMVADRLPLPERQAAFAPATVANMVQVAWGLTLSLYCRRNDVVFGVTRHGRSLVDGSREALGCFINTVPVRLAIHPSQSVGDLVQKAQTQGIEVRPHEHTALGTLHAWLGLGGALFDTVVVFERYALDADLKSAHGAFRHRTVQLVEQSSFPVVVAVYQDGPVLQVSLEFDDVPGSQPWMKAVLARFQTVLAQVLEDPTVAVRDLSMLLPGEVQALRLNAEGPLVGAPLPRSFSAAFNPVATARAEGVAMVTALGQPVSYTQIHASARHLVHRMSGLMKPDAPAVAVLSARTVECVAAQLACFLGGWTFVPLDPAWPLARVVQVLAAAKPSIVLTQTPALAAAVASATSAHGVATMALGDLLTAPTGDATEAPLPALARDPAYLIFTSGSTGTPKGVSIGMQALMAHAACAISTYALTSSDRVLQFASPAFDVALEECVPTLLAGGALIERGEDWVNDPGVFLQALQSRGVTVLNLPSAYFHLLMQHLDDLGQTLPDCIRLVVIGSEKPTTWSVQRFLASHPRTRLLNAYGPTEATITSMVCDLAALHTRGDGWADMPIGKPFGACQAFLLDARQRLCPPGVLGEVCISGPQVALGYVHGTPADDAHFIQSPLDGSRAYLTGDLGRQRPDGQLVFVGRIDQQVKVRGVRVEPGEVEDAIRRLAGVTEAVVVIHRSDRGDELVAFVTLKPNDSRDATGDIKRQLEHQLPAAFVPREIRQLEAMPMHSNGKVDRVELARQAQTVASVGRTMVAPQTDLEIYLHNVFCRLLDRDDVGNDDSFFDLGGHSLLAIQLLGAIKQVAKQALPLAAVFAQPTVRGLATLVDSNVELTLPTVVPLNAKAVNRQNHASQGAAPRPAAIYLVDGVQLYAGLASALQPHCAVYGMFLKAEEDDLMETRLQLDIVVLARAYVANLRASQPHGPYVLGGFSAGGLVACEMARQIRAEGDVVEGLILLDTILPWSIRSKGFVDGFRAVVRRGIARMLGMHPVVLWVKLRRWVNPQYGSTDHDRDEVQLRGWREKVMGAAVDHYSRDMTPHQGLVFLARTSNPLSTTSTPVESDLGWADLLDPTTPVLTVDGDHLNLLRPAGEAAIAQALATQWWGQSTNGNLCVPLSSLKRRRQ